MYKLIFAVLLLSGCSIFEPEIPEENAGLITYTELTNIITETRAEYEYLTDNTLARDTSNMPVWLQRYYYEKSLFNSSNVCHEFALLLIDNIGKRGLHAEYVPASLYTNKKWEHAFVYIDGYYADNNREYPYTRQELTHYRFNEALK